MSRNPHLFPLFSGQALNTQSLDALERASLGSRNWLPMALRTRFRWPDSGSRIR